MPFHRPIPESKPQAGAQTGQQAGAGPKRVPGLQSLVQAEKLMQIAFVLPCAMVIGWGAGWCIDHFLHTHWAVIAGLILGLVAGMVSVIRMAMEAMNSLSGQGRK
jgi:ATP synthase protein I